MSFSQQVKTARKALGLSQEDLAHELGVSFATINRWEAGNNKPSKLAKKAFEQYCLEHRITTSEDADANTHG